MTSSDAMPIRRSSGWFSARREATTTCLGSNPGRRPSVIAMSISGTMAPRKLKIPTRYGGPRGSLVSNGQSSTSSTSRTGRQNRSRPLRKTQYCDSGGRSSIGPRASSRSPVSASAGSGSRWKSSLIAYPGAPKLSYKPPHRAEQIFPGEGLRHISVRALLLAPILVARCVLRGHQDHRNRVELGVSFQVAANLKSVSVRHHDIEQNHAGLLVRDGFLDELGIVQPNRPITFFFEQALHQLDLRGRVINDQDFFVHSRALPILVHRAEVHVSSQFFRSARPCVALG